MQQVGQSIIYSASDLVGHLNCRFLTTLDLAATRGEIAKPSSYDPQAELLRERGRRHEQDYITFLTATGAQVTTIEGIGIDALSVERTKAAMAAGHEFIAQAALTSKGASGRADFLKKVETPSALGAWSYEVIDTKLAQETKGGTVLQLCLYSDLLAEAQGASPHGAYVVVPFTDFVPQDYRLDDYRAYYRQVRRSLDAALTQGDDATLYPHPIEHCEVCRWADTCDARRRADDHLSLVAGISKVQAEELTRRGIDTLAALAGTDRPIPWKPAHGAAQCYNRLREQARIQFEGREAGKTIYELLPVEAGFGLAALPPPSAGDVFFDLEGDPFVGQGGLEYLFGYAFADEAGGLQYVAEWAISAEQEKSAFETFVDFVVQRAQTYSDMHIFHYAPYEPAALKRLMGRHGSRVDEVDTLLRSLRFVDLYAATKGAMRASVESYSIKKLEPLYGFDRGVVLRDANRALARVSSALELEAEPVIEEADRQQVEGYNRDDCLSTWRLRDWLERCRLDLAAQGIVVPRPDKAPSEKSDKLTEWDEKIAGLMLQLLDGLPVALAERDDEQQARWLLAQLLDWHRREDKAVWWEYFRLSDLGVEDLVDEKAALSGLTFDCVSGGTAKAPVHRYTFPAQETDIRAGDDLKQVGGAAYGSVDAISMAECWVDIKKRQDTASSHVAAIFAHKVIGTAEQKQSLARLAERIIAHGMAGEGEDQAARDMLMRRPPRTGDHPVKLGTETGYAAALRIAPFLRAGCLPIQGPPGAGKTHTAAAMICTLAAAGQTIGVTANSHDVIRNLLDAVVTDAALRGLNLECMQKPKEKTEDLPSLKFTTKNEALYAALGTTAQVGGGVSWTWAPAPAAGCVDVLFVDEAAQMALANVLAVAQCARTVVLLGDPQQLEQPIKGSHPEGADVSALHHLLGDRQTIADDHGLFLSETWRLRPEICTFTSELFYDGRLQPIAGLEQQDIRSGGMLSGTGLRFMSVPTEGKRNESPEEAAAVGRLFSDLLQSGATWIDREGNEQALRVEDILVVTPYNAQVAKLRELLPDGARIGTVDKFQGKQAPVVIYSMTTSSHADAPRGMEFLYSLNRLNVAVSRAQCLCVIVASPAIFNVPCRTPRQMQLANAFCRYLELAEPLAA